jgi:putative hydrolase of the HAD superfamily
MKFTAVAFDLDGTLYPNYRLNIRLIPFILKEHRLLRAMDRARTKLRKSGEYENDFCGNQAKLMAGILGIPADEVREKTERLIYRGWEPFFKRIRLFPNVKETLEIFREKGIKLGLLSDFPPETKLKNLGISAYWHTVVCSEQVGRLKPDPAPFLELARSMETEAEQILYVGNSVSYDVVGARNAEMKSALIRPGWKKHFPASITRGESSPHPDFIFYDYRQLCDYVLN